MKISCEKLIANFYFSIYYKIGLSNIIQRDLLHNSFLKYNFYNYVFVAFRLNIFCYYSFLFTWINHFKLKSSMKGFNWFVLLNLFKIAQNHSHNKKISIYRFIYNEWDCLVHFWIFKIMQKIKVRLWFWFKRFDRRSYHSQ